MAGLSNASIIFRTFRVCKITNTSDLNIPFLTTRFCLFANIPEIFIYNFIAHTFAVDIDQYIGRNIERTRSGGGGIFISCLPLLPPSYPAPALKS